MVIVGARCSSTFLRTDTHVMRRVLLTMAGLLGGLTLVACLLVAVAERSVAGTAPPPDGVHVAVEDFYFDPATVPVRRGGTVVFDFVGGEHHTATDSSGLELYDSGPVAPDGPSTWFTFEAAGIFSFVCAPHEGMGGRVSVPVRVAPAFGGVHTRFTVTWASAEATADHVYDVQIRRPGAIWAFWRRAISARTDDFTPGAGRGRYRFRARLRDTGLSQASRWSEASSIRVG